MKADNNSLSQADREGLKQEVLEIFMKPDHYENINTILSVINKENTVQLVEGFQSCPRPYNGTLGFETKVWNNHGSLQTPSYGEEYDQSQYEADRNHHVILEIPDNLAQQMSDRSRLLIQLEVNIMEGEGWQEEVSYKEGPMLKLHNLFYDQ